MIAVWFVEKVVGAVCVVVAVLLLWIPAAVVDVIYKIPDSQVMRIRRYQDVVCDGLWCGLNTEEGQ